MTDTVIFVMLWNNNCQCFE